MPSVAFLNDSAVIYTDLRERFKYDRRQTLRSQSTSPLLRSDEDNLASSLSDCQHKKTITLDDSDLDARLNSWNLGVKQNAFLIYGLEMKTSS
ncbi:UNVERIFIED_CONTAM: hypothetical protein H355_015698 [Colinus virginianus]|nr:hypothetical protein H355_015698 [Colinus virginianus]